MTDIIQIAPAPCVRIPLAAACTGWTEKAIRRKIEEGKWLQDREYFKSPDGEIIRTHLIGESGGAQGYSLPL